MAKEVFMVGGAVRDELMGLAVHDKDWVVVGSTAEELLSEGYIQVGMDFPVFLHPVTKDEYALARTERKTAPGYRGFTVHADQSVTLEEDLSRRDLTMNAIARASDGSLVDPFHGVDDIEAKVLRHVSTAFREDPVRILRVARFAARYEGFTVASETVALMREMVASGEVDALVPERVWQELSKGLMERHPARMIEVLKDCGALARLLPEVDALDGVENPPIHHPEVDSLVHCLLVLEETAKMDAPLSVRYAALVHDLGKAKTPAHLLPRHLGHEKASEELAAVVSKRLKVPSDVAETAAVVAREHGCIHGSSNLDGRAIVRLLERCDAFRKRKRFADVLAACECDARGRLGLSDRAYPQRARLQTALDVALSTDTGAVARRLLERGVKGEHIGAAIKHARSSAVEAALA